MKRIVSCSLLVAALVFSGCASTRVVDNPGKITLEEALKSVGQGLHDMKDAMKDVKTGLVPSEVTVTFNITASGSDTGKLYIELSSVPVSGGLGKGGGGIDSTLSSTRGNQITVKFSNLLFTDKEKLVFEKTPEDIKKLLDTLQKSGITIYTTE